MYIFFFIMCTFFSLPISNWCQTLSSTYSALFWMVLKVAVKLALRKYIDIFVYRKHNVCSTSVNFEIFV